MTTTQSFETVLDVYHYLKSAGFKVCRSSLYNHVGQGKLRKKDGVFTLAAVGKYARTFLQRQDSGQLISDELEGLQRQKLEAEIRLKQAQADRAEFDQAIAVGQFIPRKDFELELAARAAVFDAGFRYFFQASAAELIALVQGDLKKIPEFIDALNDRLDVQLNEYASTKEYQVMILGPEGKEHDAGVE
jgi:phage terminase Nu1 subunit (DNA packaging protein)